MQKPNNFENTQAGGDYTPVELGAHYGVIKNVSERETKNGDPMIVVSIDFDKKDAQPNFFTDMFKADTREDKKYPNQATNYITTQYQGSCTKGFKSFLKAYAESNGLNIDKDIKWGDDFAAQFKGKKIGVVFGEEEQLYNGEIKMRRIIRWFCDYAKVSSQSVPEPKLWKGDRPVSSTGSVSNSAMVDADEEEIPFD